MALLDNAANNKTNDAVVVGAFALGTLAGDCSGSDSPSGSASESASSSASASTPDVLGASVGGIAAGSSAVE
jgi:hypothetical protein